MLTISTIPEALAELGKQTGRTWTDAELFDVASANAISLHAAPPITAETTIQEFVIGEGLRERHRLRPGSAALAVLFPWQVGQLWISGKTETTHPSDHDSRMEGQYHWFTEPVRVTREQVRIKAETLQKILTIWRDAQTGKARPHRIRPAWIAPPITQQDMGEKKTTPEAMKPAWIAPQVTQQEITKTSGLLSVAKPWKVKEPKKDAGYNRPLYKLLLKAFQEDEPRPTARDVLAAWLNPNTPPGLSNVTVKGLAYETALGTLKTADREAIGKAIGRMTDE